MKRTIGVLEVDILCPQCLHNEFLCDARGLCVCRGCGTIYAGMGRHDLTSVFPYRIIHNPLIEEMQKGSPLN